MKLYATVTSERASKGQGGNDYLEIELKAFNREHPIGFIVLSVHEDAEGHKDQYLLTFKRDDDDDPIILREGHWNEGEIQSIYDVLGRVDTYRALVVEMEKDKDKNKGEKQKGENDYLACIWCGKSPTLGKYARYCSDKCKREALGQQPK